MFPEDIGISSMTSIIPDLNGSRSITWSDLLGQRHCRVGTGRLMTIL